MKRAVIYTRVSRDDTGEGRSVDRQLEACRKLAELRRWDVQFELSDNSISAWSGKARPAWAKVLGLVEAGSVDVVIAWHIDRMTRSMVDLEHLILLAEERGVGVATASGDIDLTTDVGRMVARILAAVARAEVERKATRQRLANAQRAAEGAPSSGGVRPFGYEDDRVTVVEEEAAAIRQGAELALSGVPLITIAKTWAEAGLVSSRSAKAKAGWTARGVKGVLVNPRYAGIREYLGEEVGEGAWPAILDLETHLALKGKLTDPSRVKGSVKMGRTPTTLLTGLATCATCGQAVRASSIRGRLTYSCRLGHAHAPRAVADHWVEARIITLLEDRKVLAELAPKGDSRVAKAKAEAEKLGRRLDELADAYSNDAITLAQLTSSTAKLRARLDEAQATVSRAAGGVLLDGLSIGTPEVEGEWETLLLERQRAIIERLLWVELLPVSKKREPYDVEQHMAVSRRKRA